MNPETPLVSVIIPCYNQAQYLPDALNSVMAQTYTNWECIIVNDGSPDNTEEVAKEWVEKDKRFIYYEKENEGPSSARNFGIKKSNGKYILPLDSDDFIGPQYLEKGVEILKKGTYDVVYCNAQFFGGKSGKWRLPEFSADRLLLTNIVFCSAIYKKVDFERFGGYNPNMKLGLEDWDFWLSLLELNCKFYKIPEILFFYRINNDVSRQQSINKFQKKHLFKQIFLNHVDLYFDRLGPPQAAFESISEFKNSVSWPIYRTLRYLKRRICSKN